MTSTYVRRTTIPRPADEVFAWHTRPGALERLMPPWESTEVVARQGGMEVGSRVTLRMRVGPLPCTWEAEHTALEPGRSFTDRQVRGPFARWEHQHTVHPDGDDRCVLEDSVTYALPLGALGRAFGGSMVRARIDRLFDHRHATTAADLAAHARLEEAEMKIAITGSTGLVGSELIPFLTTGGHEAIRLVRSSPAPGDIAWNPTAGSVDAAALEGVDAVVHLAGESIAEGRWNDAKKERIRASRVDGTRLLAETLAALDRKPRVLVAASAIGFYGDRGDDVMREDASAGQGFLSDVCREWEAATEAARAAGIRVVNLRIGVVLSPKGGALAKMLTPFKLGVGGVIGNGRQYMSWISIDDLVGLIHHAIATDGVEGPLNAVAPNAVSNREFTKTLGRVLGRPTIAPMPAIAARLAFGEMADALLLASTRVSAERAVASGYAYRHSELQTALEHLLGK